MTRSGQERHRIEKWIFRTVGASVLFYLAAPMLIIMFAALDPGTFFNFPPSSLSLRWFKAFFKDEAWMSALGLSLQIASITALLSVIIGGSAGIAIARVSRHFRPAFYAVLVAPLTIPVIVIGIAFYGVALDLGQIGSLWAFVTVTTLIATPLVAVLVLSAALTLDRDLEFASLSCGASRLRTIRSVTLPHVAPTAVAGGILAFLITLDEVVMSLFLVAPGQTPLAVRMFLQVEQGTPPIVTAVSTLLILGSVFAVFVLIAMRRIAASFGLAGMDVTRGTGGGY